MTENNDRGDDYSKGLTPREIFGEALRNARETRAAGKLTQSELARMARTSKSTISRIERGVPPIGSHLPALFDQIFETDGLFKRLYEEVVSQSYPALFRRRMAMEREAIAIREWSPTLIPGLFESPAYARALFRFANRRASDAEVADLVRARLIRQELFRKEAPPKVSLILCESALDRSIGHAHTMREQLAVLLSRSALPTTRVQVLPLNAEPHPLMDGPITLLTTPHHLTVVSVEAFRTASIIEDPEHVRAAMAAYDDLMSEAFSTRESAALIRKKLEAL
ncbi:helix-turn-helix transcriptional regulator [Streptomyces sp. NPDC093085]|uniref:helix-turn-helix domain-containing protein n=1 Tax=Streptomyces sp. NPDC093085 TaxID=3155068 RepID=UPI00341C23FE